MAQLSLLVLLNTETTLISRKCLLALQLNKLLEDFPADAFLLQALSGLQKKRMERLSELGISNI